MAGILSMDADQLKTQIALAEKFQGTRNDPMTGEEPGKIHHEYPGVGLKGRGKYLTTYNACDTTALYLVAIEALGNVDPRAYAAITSMQRPTIVLAVSYILQHVTDTIFYEYPPEGADRFAVKVTYWKDSIASDPAVSELRYPVAYALAHFQAARGLLSAARILQDQDLLQAADAMFKAGIHTFMRSEQFVVAIGDHFKMAHSSSDELHALAYIPRSYYPLLPLGAIQRRSKALVSSAGFACMPRSIAAHLTNTYHGYVVWPFEQAFIHYGSIKFNLHACAGVAERVAPFIAQGNELIVLEPELEPSGNNRQLWSVAAGSYFHNHSNLRIRRWL
ncbi:MAG TPA: hypothetical protein VMR98_05910 [Candidatus Polarisedimenticolaceae bacterium]|nr:hypothetical protein [Candidatus Polarisedimenticolaceae bacterium]